MTGKRTIRFRFWVNDEENTLIHDRKAKSGIVSMSAFLRKMAIDGYHINVDMTAVREMIRLLRNVSNNINQIAKRANETRNIYAADVEDLRCQQAMIWNDVKKILQGFAKIK